MPKFLFQLDPIDGYEFHPVPIYIHLGIIKIPNEEIIDDFGINTTETIIVGTDRKELLNWMQEHFARDFRRFGIFKESDSLLRKYDIKQAWARMRKHIKKYPNNKDALRK
jgi:hypothetical protein